MTQTNLTVPSVVLVLLGSRRTVGEDRISRDASVIPYSGLVLDAPHRGERSPTLEHEREIDRWLKRAIRRERSARLYGGVR
jgi:hypothetical protein